MVSVHTYLPHPTPVAPIRHSLPLYCYSPIELVIKMYSVSPRVADTLSYLNFSALTSIQEWSRICRNYILFFVMCAMGI